MQVLTTILYILLFIVFLSILIIVHELGHLAMAKTFNVYCLEYSVGMGPLLFKYKRKNGETQFSLRAIPFGGYVSMYGEGVELPDGVEIPQSRSLNGIKWWKRAIILIAGVTMNTLLALTFFFVANCLPQERLYRNAVNIEQSSLAYESGLRDGDIFALGDLITYQDQVSNSEKHFYILDNQATFNNDDSVKYSACITTDFLNFSNRDLSSAIFVYKIKDNGPSFADIIIPADYESLQVHFSILKPGSDGKTIDHAVKVSIPVNDDKDGYASFGASFFYEKKMQSFGSIVKNTFTEFGENSIVLFKAVGMLFNPQNWGQVSGIVGVAFETTAVLRDFGFANFLRIWGLISANLAIFNLLPFPGLDGWQLLVTFVEAGTRKKIPDKVKNIVSLIGLGLLLLLMGVILIKDVFTYILVGLL